MFRCADRIAGENYQSQGHRTTKAKATPLVQVSKLVERIVCPQSSCAGVFVSPDDHSHCKVLLRMVMASNVGVLHDWGSPNSRASSLVETRLHLVEHGAEVGHLYRFEKLVQVRRMVMLVDQRHLQVRTCETRNFRLVTRVLCVAQKLEQSRKEIGLNSIRG